MFRRGSVIAVHGNTTDGPTLQTSPTALIPLPLTSCSLFLLAGSVDSNWIVGATLEKKLIPLPLSLALGAFLNHRKNKFQCGFGVTIG